MVAPSSSGLQGTRSGPNVVREDVESMLLDQRILFEMRLRTMKLEIMQHVTDEFARLRDFISTLVPPSGGTSTSAAALVVNEPNIWDDSHEVGEGSDKQSPHDNDHADQGEMHKVNDGKGREEWSPQDDNHAEEGDMQETPDAGRQKIHSEG
ncbi:Hypothetical predicted protein [Olea europaea subsp. europaea]|uniref:Uncharacterized protein n=1 Tax=Olea europaea subsp. europaea TaxID=158383 RepID=A0A8S0PLE1_OLEEU|nr:Hypothetical predicted protein [Olea europaea subsp. europaea]